MNLGAPASCRRVANGYVAIMGGWLATTLKTWTLQALSPEQAALVLGALGMKTYQRGKESDVKPAG
jgi:hypothetical protein